MTQLLLRAPKDPFEVRSADETFELNLIAGNSGNLVFIDAAWKLLSAPGVTITPDRLNVGPADADRINERYDAYVVPLANAFRPSYLRNLESLTALIGRLRIPVVVLGVGAQGTVDGNWGAVRKIEPAVKAFVAAVLDRSPRIGVRGEATFDYLARLGFRDVDVIGCPSMFLWGDRLRVEPRVPVLDTDARLAVTISPYRAAMGDIALAAYRRYPGFTYFAQDLDTLMLMLYGDPLPKGTPDAKVPVHPAHPFFRERRTRLYLDPWPWISDLREFDFCFGTRIHGSIAALLAGTPAVVLAHDSRTLELARYFDIPYRLLRDLPLDIDPARLYEEADYTRFNEGHAARLRVFLDYLALHGLDTCLAHDGAPEAFDRRVAATTYPGPVMMDGDLTGGGGVRSSARRLWMKTRSNPVVRRLYGHRP